MKNKEELGMCVEIVVVFIFFTMMILIGLMPVIIKVRNNSCETNVIKTEATVVKKKEESNRIYNGKNYITTYSYYLYTNIAGNEEEQRIQVPQSYYNKINENDTVMVDITVDKENKIINMDLSK